METAAEIIKDAFIELGVIDPSETLAAADEASGIRYMNRVVSSEQSSGLSLGYTPISSVSDYVTIPDYAYAWLTKRLAVELSGQYGVAVTTELASLTSVLYSALRSKVVRIGQPTRPDTLPKGSGNDDSYYSDQFYADAAKALARLGGNTTATVLSGSATAVLGAWISDESNGFSISSAGVIKHTVDRALPVTVDILLTITSSTPQSLDIYLAKQAKGGLMVNQPNTKRTMSITSEASEHRFVLYETLFDGDAIQLWAKAGADATVTDAVIHVYAR